MTTPCIITVAITGSLPRKKDNPSVPISVAEQVESTQEAFEAGATLLERCLTEVLVADREHVEGDVRRGNLGRKLLHA